MKNFRAASIVTLAFAAALAFSLTLAFAADKDDKGKGKEFKKPETKFDPTKPKEEEEEKADENSPFGEGKEKSDVKEEVEAQVLDKEMVGKTMQRHYKAITYCYQKEVNKDKTLKGKVVVAFKIQIDGSVTDISFDKDKTTLKSKAVQECIAGKLKVIKFPERKKGEPQPVTFPFKFEAK